MFCKNCGVMNYDDDVFCGNCGASLANVDNQGTELSWQSKKQTNRSEYRVPQSQHYTTASGKKDNLLPLIIILIIVVVFVAGLIGFMLLRNMGAMDNKPSIAGQSGENATNPPVTNTVSQNEVSQPSATVPPSPLPNGDYLFPSDSEYITEAYLCTLTREQVALIRNEIFARHGYIFKTPEYQSYFSGKSWYVPNPNFVDSVFNSIEKANKDTLVAYEQKMGWR